MLHAGVVHTPAQVFVVAPQRAQPAGANLTGGADRRQATDPLRSQLDEQTIRVITSMPPEAQQLLTVPMAATGETVLRDHCFWQGPAPEALEVVFVVLASAGRVTIANGARAIPPGADPATAHWALDCWHAEVLSRRGR